MTIKGKMSSLFAQLFPKYWSTTPYWCMAGFYPDIRGISQSLTNLQFSMPGWCQSWRQLYCMRCLGGALQHCVCHAVKQRCTTSMTLILLLSSHWWERVLTSKTSNVVYSYQADHTWDVFWKVLVTSRLLSNSKSSAVW